MAAARNRPRPPRPLQKSQMSVASAWSCCSLPGEPEFSSGGCRYAREASAVHLAVTRRRSATFWPSALSVDRVASSFAAQSPKQGSGMRVRGIGKTIAMAALALCAMVAQSGSGAVNAADLVWEVENPFRLYRHSRSFKLHEDAFKTARGTESDPVPSDIIQRVEQ